MINEENLNKLYEEVINDTILTTKNLNSYGFNSKDIKNLINDDVLIRVKRGLYEFIDSENLYNYNKKIYEDKEKSFKCLEKCFSIKPTNSMTFQLFIQTLKKHDYEKVFYYFDYLYEKNLNNQNDYNLYLYLLNMITDVPDKYKEIVKNIKLDDMINKKFNFLHPINKIRISVSNQRLKLASNQLREYLNNKNCIPSLFLTSELLYQTIGLENDRIDKIIKLLEDEKYDYVVQILENVKIKHQLNQTENYILTLTYDLLNIKNTNKIPDKIETSTDDFFEAIDNKNYELAVSLYDSKISNKAIYILLENIIKETRKKIKMEEFQLETVTFKDIIVSLMNNDIENSIQTLNKYLKNINQEKYMFLIVNLIKISLLENDQAFTKPMLALSLIVNENFKFDLSEYIQNFYQTLALKEFDKTKIYLDIIEKSEQLGQTCILTNNLKQILEITEQQYNKKNIEEEQNDLKIENIASPILIEQEKIVKKTKKEKIVKPIYDDEKFIKSKLDLIKEQGIILLKPMEKERADNIYRIIEEMPNLNLFTIKDGLNIRIVIKYQLDGHIDFKEYIQKAKEAEINKDFGKALEFYREIIGHSRVGYSYTYYKIGILYLKKRNKDMAITYLKVASHLCKRENKTYDYDDFILRLKGYIDIDDQKPLFKMEEQEFYEDFDSKYNLDIIDGIIYLEEKGLSIEEIKDYFDLTEEQEALSLVVLAQKYYREGLLIKAEKYIKRVEKMRNKTKECIKLLDEVKRNKKFYKNRIVPIDLD